jgi:hypothetical protein
MSKGKVNCLVGHTKTGKTTYIKENYCSKVNDKDIIAYVRIRDDFDIKGANVYNNFEEFLRIASRKKDSLIIIDEAWTALPDKVNISMSKQNKLDNILANFLVNAPKMNNFVFIIYHSFSQIPSKWLISYLDFLIAFKTNDMYNVQIRRFTSYPEIAKYLSSKPITENYIKKTLKLR